MINVTSAVNFQREAAFEHADSKTVVAMPQPNGTIYTFGRDVNILWRHGILQVGVLNVFIFIMSSILCGQVPPEQQKEEGRISIIAWGWVPQTEV